MLKRIIKGMTAEAIYSLHRQYSLALEKFSRAEQCYRVTAKAY